MVSTNLLKRLNRNKIDSYSLRMRHSRYIISAFLFFVASSLCARENTVTLKSSAGDIKVALRYDVVTSDDECTIRFKTISKELEPGPSRKYDVDKVRILFFETNGSYSKDKFSYKIGTKPLSFNSDEWTYERHEEGYVWLDDKPELHLTIRVPETKLSIPIYLAYYKRKHTYEVIADCGLLEIPLKKSQHQKCDAESARPKTATRTITIEEEVEGEREMTPEETAQFYIKRITKLLDQYDGDTSPEGLENDVRELRCLLIKNKDIQLEINDLLDKFDKKKKQAEQNAEKRAAEEEKEKQVRRALEYLNERLGKIDELTEKDLYALNDKANELEEKSFDINDQELRGQIKDAIGQVNKKVKEFEDAKKRRKVWTIIGGALLAVFMFIGNQALQHFRNLRNQKGIAEMQDRMVRRAENEARRRTQNTVRSKVNRVKNKAIDKGRETVRKGVKSSVGTIGNKNKGNGNQKYTI